MIESQRRNFTTLYSIELSKELYQKAKVKFKNFQHIHLVQGDSGEKMGEIVSKLKSPAIFWLDGHYSGGNTAKGKTDCPIMEELEAIFKSDLDHCILIDDARLCGTDPDYPTIEELNTYVNANREGYSINSSDDIVRIVKK